MGGRGVLRGCGVWCVWGWWRGGLVVWVVCSPPWVGVLCVIGWWGVLGWCAVGAWLLVLARFRAGRPVIPSAGDEGVCCGVA